ncbi:hypothetical protein E2C01_089860 [Portunus trituberculatus]|uniref:Uncharacterized protein n=1 Tax=Portunus trituberculatus TaxID=210409 RepID=A0A5B7J9Y9_PORTR|nr:hypothetical protein [Portunus trituberculatus]
MEQEAANCLLSSCHTLPPIPSCLPSFDPIHPAGLPSIFRLPSLVSASPSRTGYPTPAPLAPYAQRYIHSMCVCTFL